MERWCDNLRVVLSILYAPTIYFALKYFDINMAVLLTFKLFPLFMSVLVTVLILISYYKKSSMVLKFAKKYAKFEITKDEEDYIQRSTLFWVGVSSVNILVHIYMYFQTNIELWVFYASIGWYSVFILGAILQFAHRQFVFKKREKDESNSI